MPPLLREEPCGYLIAYWVINAGVMMKAMFSAILEEIKDQGNYRTIKYLHPLSATRVRYKGNEYLNLCSNSYLSLHTHPEVLLAAKEAIDEYGAGICSSRSVSGSIDLYEMLEKEIAKL